MSLLLRRVKGTALTHEEMDENWLYSAVQLGSWDSEFDYTSDNLAVHNGTIYLAMAASFGVTPGTNPAYWQPYTSPHTHGFADIAAAVLDEDDLNSNSAVHVPTQQSVKAYVDAIVGGGGYTNEMAQDAVGAIIGNSTSVDMTYNDVANTIRSTIRLSGTSLVVDGTGVKVNDLGIATGMIAASAVTTAKIADEAITEAKIDSMTAAVADYVLTYDASGRMKWTAGLNTEAVQDLVGGMLSNSSQITLTYDDPTGKIVANVVAASITEAQLDINGAPTADYFLAYNGTLFKPEWRQLIGYSAATARADIGAILVDTNSVDLHFDAGVPSITANVRRSGATIEEDASGIKVGNGVITTLQLQDDAVVAAKIADGSVGASKLDVSGTPTTGSLVGYDGSDLIWRTPYSEPILSGANMPERSIVTVYSDAGTSKVRLADATDDTSLSFGYILDAATIGNPVIVHFAGVIDGFTALSPGARYFLSVAGTIDTAPITPAVVGNVVQPVGFALTSTKLLFIPTGDYDVVRST